MSQGGANNLEDPQLNLPALASPGICGEVHIFKAVSLPSHPRLRTPSFGSPQLMPLTHSPHFARVEKAVEDDVHHSELPPKPQTLNPSLSILPPEKGPMQRHTIWTTMHQLSR